MSATIDASGFLEYFRASAGVRVGFAEMITITIRLLLLLSLLLLLVVVGVVVTLIIILGRLI